MMHCQTIVAGSLSSVDGLSLGGAGNRVYPVTPVDSPTPADWENSVYWGSQGVLE